MNSGAALERAQERAFRECIEASLADELPMIPATRAADVLGLSRRTLNELVRTGALRAVKHGQHRSGRVFIPREAAVDFLAGRRAR